MVDEVLAAVASRQYGLFSRAQVQSAGCGDSLIKRRLRTGNWLHMAPGVYSLPGWPASWRRSLMLAVLDASAGAVVSHESAAALHGFTTFTPGRVVITVPHGHHQRPSGAEVHQCTDLRPCDRTVVDGLPVTTTARTLFDLAASCRRGRLTAALEDAVLDRSCSLEELRELYTALARPGKRGMSLLKAVLVERGPGYVPPGSRLERRLLKVLADGGLPEPRRQYPLPWGPEAGGRVDLAYPEHRVIIEADGRRWHTRVEDFEADKARDRAANLSGWSTYRFTWLEIMKHPEMVVDTVRRALSRVPST